VAKNYSNDPAYRANQGEYGPMAYEELPREISPAARALKDKSQVSELIETPSGYYVVVLVNRTPSSVAPFEKVKGEIIMAEQKEFVRNMVDRKLGEFMDKDTQYYLDNIEGMRVDIDREKLRRMHQEAVDERAAPKTR